MQITLAGVGILSLFLIMLVPVYAEVIEISVEKSFYTIDEKISFSGNDEEGSAMISVVVKDPNGKRNYVIGTISNSEGKFETTPVNAKNIFSTIGIYEFTAFTLKEENGSSISLKFDGDRILEEEKPLLQLNLIEDKIKISDEFYRLKYAEKMLDIDEDINQLSNNSLIELVWKVKYLPTAEH